MLHRSRVRMRGPLAPHQDVIWTDLLSRGYSPLSAKNLLRVAAHLSRWLQVKGLSAQDLTRERIGKFLSDRRACGYTCGLTPRSLEPILLPLRAHNVASAPEALPQQDSPPGSIAARVRVLPAAGPGPGIHHR